VSAMVEIVHGSEVGRERSVDLIADLLRLDLI